MKIIEHDYEIKLDFKPGENNPEDLYFAMISAFRYLHESDNVLAKTISNDNSASMSLLSIKEGSLRNFVRVRTEFPETELQPENGDNEEKIKRYFSEGKKAITQGLLALSEISREDQLQKIVDDVNDVADECEITSEPFYLAPTTEQIKKLAIVAEETGSYLDDNSQILYIEEDKPPIQLPKKISVDKELFSDIEERKKIISERVIVLKVKKPDYLGESRWEMKHGKHRIICKIEDATWLGRFKRKEVLVFPGDSLECNVRLEETYDTNGELVNTEYTIIEVKDVIQGSEED